MVRWNTASSHLKEKWLHKLYILILNHDKDKMFIFNFSDSWKDVTIIWPSHNFLKTTFCVLQHIKFQIAVHVGDWEICVATSLLLVFLVHEFMLWYWLRRIIWEILYLWSWELQKLPQRGRVKAQMLGMDVNVKVVYSRCNAIFNNLLWIFIT